jgi:murein L,D-transpeptidase YcbB/YkuD
MRQGADDLRVNTPRAIPVFIVYTTAFQRDGRMHYGNDLYHRDDSLVKVMAGAATPGPQAMKAAAALLQLANR